LKKRREKATLAPITSRVNSSNGIEWGRGKGGSEKDHPRNAENLKEGGSKGGTTHGRNCNANATSSNTEKEETVLPVLRLRSNILPCQKVTEGRKGGKQL